MSGTDIFLSYARHDRATAHMFADGFAREGFSVWWDASLHSGQTFDEIIEQELRASKAVVVLWSPRSVASRWVRAEATQADRKNKLAPAIIEPCDRPIIFELTHAADLVGWTGDMSDIRWRTFMDDLRRLIEAAKDQESQAAPRPASGSDRPAINDLEDVGRREPTPQRRPLRPGSQDVIFAREPTVHRLQQPARAASRPVEPEVPSDVHCLELQDANPGEDLFVIGTSSARIGRKPPADIVISDKSISREHCIVGLANDELVVTDLNSTNGTYVDEQRISRATILPVGSMLRVGQVSLKHAIRPVSETEWLGGAGLDTPRLAAMP